MTLKNLKYSPKCDLHKGREKKKKAALCLGTAFTWEDVLEVVFKMTEANLTIYHN